MAGSEMTEAKRRRLDKVVNDPIHGHIVLPELCVRIIDTVQFQRLRHIKQLGGCYLVYPGATHTRFEHSLGVCHLAGTMMRHLQTNQPELKINEADVLCVQVAGLCHDLGHGPFSHLFEEFVNRANGFTGENKWKHETVSIEMLEHLITVNGIKLENFSLKKDDLEFIKHLITRPEGAANIGRGIDKPYLYQIVANEASGIDVDKWDYFARDCHHLGMSSMFDHKRLIQFCRVIDNQICFRDKEVQNIYEMFHIRYTLHRKAYQHKTNKCVEEMLIDAFVKANDSIDIDFVKEDGTSDTCRMSDCHEKISAYATLTDNVFDSILKCKRHGAPDTRERLEKGQTILKRITKRNLPVLAGEARLNERSKMTESEISDGIAKLKDCPDQTTYFIKIVKFNYSRGKKDPLDKVKFFDKNDKVVPIQADRMASLLPKSFEERLVRIYSWDKANKEILRKCFKDWCTDCEYLGPEPTVS